VRLFNPKILGTTPRRHSDSVNKVQRLTSSLLSAIEWNGAALESRFHKLIQRAAGPEAGPYAALLPILAVVYVLVYALAIFVLLVVGIVALIVFAPLLPIAALDVLISLFGPELTINTVARDFESFKVSLKGLVSKVFLPRIVNGLGLPSLLLAGAVVATLWVIKVMLFLGLVFPILVILLTPPAMVTFVLMGGPAWGTAAYNMGIAIAFAIALFTYFLYWRWLARV